MIATALPPRPAVPPLRATLLAMPLTGTVAVPALPVEIAAFALPPEIGPVADAPSAFPMSAGSPSLVQPEPFSEAPIPLPDSAARAEAGPQASDRSTEPVAEPAAVDQVVGAMIAALAVVPTRMAAVQPPAAAPDAEPGPAPVLQAQPAAMVGGAPPPVPDAAKTAPIARPLRPADQGAKPADVTPVSDVIDFTAALSREAPPVATIASVAPPAPASIIPSQPVGLAPGIAPAREVQVDGDGVWLAEVARDIARAADPGQPLMFRLRPEALGALRIEMARQEDGMALRIVTESEAARSALAEGQQRLFAEARSYGVRIGEAVLSVVEPNAADSGGSSSALAQQHQDRRHNDGNRSAASANTPLRREAPDLDNHDRAGTGDRYA